MHSIIGKNVLTVLLSSTDDVNRLKAFFCPYTQQITTTYQGEVQAILPGYNPEETPQVMIQPQRMKYHANINYSFRETYNKDASVSFWIQDQYFDENLVKTYYCFNCKNPQLLFSEDRVVLYKNKNELKNNQSFICDNINCKQSLNFLGIVKIKDVNYI